MEYIFWVGPAINHLNNGLLQYPSCNRPQLYEEYKNFFILFIIFLQHNCVWIVQYMYSMNSDSVEEVIRGKQYLEYLWFL